MSKYTAEQVSDWLRQRAVGQYVQKTDAALNLMADAIDVLLRERESASARVPNGLMSLLTEMVTLHDKRQCVLTVHMERLKELLAAAPMLASARVPDEKEDLDPVRLRREGRVATEWERGFNEGWNDCRDAMLAAAPKPETE